MPFIHTFFKANNISSFITAACNPCCNSQFWWITLYCHICYLLILIELLEAIWILRCWTEDLMQHMINISWPIRGQHWFRYWYVAFQLVMWYVIHPFVLSFKQKLLIGSHFMHCRVSQSSLLCLIFPLFAQLHNSKMQCIFTIAYRIAWVSHSDNFQCYILTFQVIDIVFLMFEYGPS